MQNEIMKRNVEKRHSEPRQNLVYRVDRCSVVLLWLKNRTNNKIDLYF